MIINFFRALQVFIYLLKSSEWYVIAEEKSGKSHLRDCNIRCDKLQFNVAKDIDTHINQETLLEEAKQIILTK